MLGLDERQGGEILLSACPARASPSTPGIGYVPQRHSLSASVRATVERDRRGRRLPHRPWWRPAGATTGRSWPPRSRTSASPTAPTRRSPRCPAASSGGCSSPARSPAAPTCSSWTSRPRASTTPARRRSPRCSAAARGPRHLDAHRHPRARRAGGRRHAASCASTAGASTSTATRRVRRAHRRTTPPARATTTTTRTPRPGPQRCRLGRSTRPRGCPVTELLALDFMRAGAARRPARRRRRAARRRVPRPAPDVAHR